VLGSGIMGRQVSALMSLLNFNVTILSRKNYIKEINWEKKKLSKLLKIEFNANVIQYNNLDEKYNQNSLIIECISENLDLKKKIYEKFKHIKYGYYTNSSSFVSLEISETTGLMHFFNPINLKILEVIKPMQINVEYDLVYEAILKRLKDINFKIFNVKPNRGYLGNSIIFFQISNFFYLYEKLKYHKDDILNISKKLEINLDILNIIDLVGVDTCFNILKNLNEKDNRFYVPILFEKALEKNILGKKNKTSIKDLFADG
jgi:3-hydroxyacyl-CoA dehydrogenase